MKFIEKNIFKDKKTAFFVSSVEPTDEAIAKYVKLTLEKHPHLNPVATDAFGGRMRFLGRTTSDKRDFNRVRRWAEELGKKVIG